MFYICLGINVLSHKKKNHLHPWSLVLRIKWDNACYYQDHWLALSPQQMLILGPFLFCFVLFYSSLPLSLFPLSFLPSFFPYFTPPTLILPNCGYIIRRVHIWLYLKVFIILGGTFKWECFTFPSLYFCHFLCVLFMPNRAID